jgi:hypothetical protein
LRVVFREELSDAALRSIAADNLPRLDPVLRLKIAVAVIDPLMGAEPEQAVVPQFENGGA